ncbi:MAG TPA: ATP-binding cassette domain-containing protein [Dehalococcoidia bacterium]|nr:ATP-binding cassette domain-containing protein [Dehalococcoidia bacterium]
MISLALSNVTKYFGARPVLQGVSWEIQDDEVIGLVGPNGAGKSTLLKLIIGEEETDGGSVIRSRDVTIGYLAQTPEFDADRTALDEVLAADDELAAIEAELQRHEASMGQPAVYEDEE